jgi:hypothetical protein
MARDVQDARVPRSAWMRESGPDRIGRRLRRLVVAALLRLSRDFVALGANL